MITALLQTLRQNEHFDDIVDVEVIETIQATAAIITRLKVVKQNETRHIIYKDFRDQWLGGGRAELSWYAEFAPFITPRICPSFYGGEINEQSRRGYLLLGDITETYDKVSASWPSSNKKLESLEPVVDVLLRLHVHWWGHRSLEDDLFMRPQGGPLRLAHATTPETIENYVQALQHSFPHIVDSLKPDLSPDWIAICEQAVHSWASLLTRRVHRGEKLTLLHGDFHIWNLFFPRHPQPDHPLVADWETYKRGIGVYDLAYLLLTSLNISMRREQEKALLKRYHHGLQAAGIDGYSWQDCVQDYRLSIIANLFPPLMWRRVESLRPVMAAFVDWQCGQLLAES